MTYNLSPDKIILFQKRAESLKASSKKLHKINFKFNGRDVLAWSIEHENQAEMKGLYPKVLEKLLIRCNLLKSRLAPLKNKKEELEKEISLAETSGEDITDALKSEYFSVSFIVTCLDAKQLTLKVYMNTFYGEVGNSGSPFFLRALAGGVISAGQWNIKPIADFIRSKGFGVKYGILIYYTLFVQKNIFGSVMRNIFQKRYQRKSTGRRWWEYLCTVALSICVKRQDSINVDVNMSRAMIGRIKTFSLSTITALSKDDIKYIIAKGITPYITAPVTCISGNICYSVEK
ncbi:hypothetical protein C1646_785749 [Rhizophagus diaphanus]|nr:hypothetical protein C1646_785749 [Rhizophagus diaphanus] [Rhizophagus sp. MUCL 43196]